MNRHVRLLVGPVGLALLAGVGILGWTGPAHARQSNFSPSLAAKTPDAYTISTLGGCDEHTVSLVDPLGGPLPLRTSGIVAISDQTGYDLTTAFLPRVDFSGVLTTEVKVRLCLPAPVEIVEPLVIRVTAFSTACESIANTCVLTLPMPVTRVAPQPPGAPTSVSASPLDGSARVTWSEPTRNGGAPISGYTATASPGGQSCTSTVTSCTVTGLMNGTEYTFTVTAANIAGTSAASTPSAAVTPEARVTPPGAVTALKASPLKGGLRVAWSPPMDTGGAVAITYRYRVGRGPWTATASTAIRVNGAKGKTLAVAVQAVNEEGTGPISIVRGVPR